VRDLFRFVNRGRFETEGVNARHARVSDERVLASAWGVMLRMDEEFACFSVSARVKAEKDIIDCGGNPRLTREFIS